MSKTTMLHLETALSEADQILERAILLSGGAPFFMQAEEEYAKLAIEGDMATLAWPEYTSDYYGGGYLERQSVQFPSELLLMSIEEIHAWKEEKKKEYDAKEKERHTLEARQRAEWQKSQELQTLAILKAKYGA